MLRNELSIVAPPVAAGHVFPVFQNVCENRLVHRRYEV